MVLASLFVNYTAILWRHCANQETFQKHLLRMQNVSEKSEKVCVTDVACAGKQGNILGRIEIHERFRNNVSSFAMGWSYWLFGSTGMRARSSPFRLVLRMTAWKCRGMGAESTRADFKFFPVTMVIINGNFKSKLRFTDITSCKWHIVCANFILTHPSWVKYNNRVDVRGRKYVFGSTQSHFSPSRFYYYY